MDSLTKKAVKSGLFFGGGMAVFKALMELNTALKLAIEYDAEHSQRIWLPMKENQLFAGYLHLTNSWFSLHQLSLH